MVKSESNYDRKFFKKWSHDMAYILGFIFADGNLVKSKRGTHYLAIYTNDKGLLEGMCMKMKVLNKISLKKSKLGSGYRVQIGSKELFNDLARYNLTPNKSKRLKFPKLPKKYVGDFIRGYFDGDGCVWLGYAHKTRVKQTLSLQVSFTSASHKFLECLLYLLNTHKVKGGSLFRSKKGGYSRLIFGMAASLKIYKIMYNGPCELFLHRKRLIFEKIH